MSHSEISEPNNGKDRFEKWLDNNIEMVMIRARYLTLIPVIFSYIGALFMFAVGTVRTYDALIAMVHYQWRGTQVNLILSVDAFLMGLVLMIFSYGIYDLFISSLDAGGSKARLRPRWMQFDDIGGLKIILAEVILIIMMIEFFQLALSEMKHFKTFEQILIIPIGMLLIAVGMGVFKKLTHESKDDSAEQDKDQ
jgi:uncharacterized membrane protein YqhA